MQSFFPVRVLLLCLGLFLISSNCGTPPDDPKEDFDRKEMLRNYGENLIIPGYEQYVAEAEKLQDAVLQFTNAPDAAKLTAARAALKSAWLKWQQVSVFELGPAADISLRANTNTFPADTAKINSNISSGSYNLDAAANIAAKGFPAIDFLLNSNSEQVTVQNFSSINRQQYLNDLTGRLVTEAAGVLAEWQPTGGNYLQQWINAAGTDVGSSVGALVNQFNYDLEITKNARLGIPLGVRTLGQPLPDRVEALYGRYSAELASGHLMVLQQVFMGDGFSGTGNIGLDDYLDHVDAKHTGQLLSEVIYAQMEKAIIANEAVPDPLSEQVVSNTQVVETAYAETQKIVVLTKVDMPSALGVVITYQDNDGD